jgi:hypothetical protein
MIWFGGWIGHASVSTVDTACCGCAALLACLRHLHKTVSPWTERERPDSLGVNGGDRRRKNPTCLSRIRHAHDMRMKDIGARWA